MCGIAGGRKAARTARKGYDPGGRQGRRAPPPAPKAAPWADLASRGHEGESTAVDQGIRAHAGERPGLESDVQPYPEGRIKLSLEQVRVVLRDVGTQVHLDTFSFISLAIPSPPRVGVVTASRLQPDVSQLSVSVSSSSKANEASGFPSVMRIPCFCSKPMSVPAFSTIFGASDARPLPRLSGSFFPPSAFRPRPRPRRRGGPSLPRCPPA